MIDEAIRTDRDEDLDLDEGMTATYSPEDNKLRLYADYRLDAETYQRVRAAGFKWAPKQQLFVAPAWTPQREDLLLDLCGEVGDEDYSPEERAADRAERFSGYRDRRSGEACELADRYEAGPRVFGHQNLRRAERQAARHDRVRHNAVSQWSKAEYWQMRTEGVIRHALHKSSAPVRRGRIKKLETELRKHQKSHEEAIRRYKAWSEVPKLPGADKPLVDDKGEPLKPVMAAGVLAYRLANYGCYGTYWHPRTGENASLYSMLTSPVDPITPGEAAKLWLASCPDPESPVSGWHRWTQHYEMRLTYERAMLAHEGGAASDVEMEVGGWLGEYRIDKVNRSRATGKVVSVTLRLPGGRTELFNIERLPEGVYRSPTDEERKQFEAETKELKAKAKAAKGKATPLINPTDEDAERLQAIWNAHARESCNPDFGNADLPDSQVLRITQAQYSELSGKTHSPYETIEVTEQLKKRSKTVMGHDRNGRVTVFKVRRTRGLEAGVANRVIVLTDKPRKPIPWDAVEAAAAEQPTPEKMLPHLEELSKVCAMNWLPDRGTPEYQLLQDGVYLGWAYISSMSQFGWTEKGAAMLRQSRRSA